MEDSPKNNNLKCAEDKVEDLKKAIQECGFDINETEEGIEILEKKNN